MNLDKLDAQYWEDRYLNQLTGWDTGSITKPLKDYIDQLPDKDLKILIPGGGNSYEAEYLHNNGFKNVHVVELAPSPLNNLITRCPDFPTEHLLLKDFFELSEQFDLILEQTFFCALHPSLRPEYARKMHSLLKPGGKLVGLLFEGEFAAEGPPFGGSIEEYKRYFDPFFIFKNFSKAYNSIKPREGKELFINLVRK